MKNTNYIEDAMLVNICGGTDPDQVLQASDPSSKITGTDVRPGSGGGGGVGSPGGIEDQGGTGGNQTFGV